MIHTLKNWIYKGTNNIIIDKNAVYWLSETRIVPDSTTKLKILNFHSLPFLVCYSQLKTIISSLKKKSRVIKLKEQINIKRSFKFKVEFSFPVCSMIKNDTETDVCSCCLFIGFVADVVANSDTITQLFCENIKWIFNLAQWYTHTAINLTVPFLLLTKTKKIKMAHLKTNLQVYEVNWANWNNSLRTYWLIFYTFPTFIPETIKKVSIVIDNCQMYFRKQKFCSD